MLEIKQIEIDKLFKNTHNNPFIIKTKGRPAVILHETCNSIDILRAYFYSVAVSMGYLLNNQMTTKIDDLIDSLSKTEWDILGRSRITSSHWRSKWNLKKTKTS